MYHYFGEMYKHFEYDKVIQLKVLQRWDFASTEFTSVSYMLTPKFAGDGFYVDNDKIDSLAYVKKLVDARHPGLGDRAEEEAGQFMSKMSSLTGQARESTFKLDAKCYWNIVGRSEFPTLFLCAQSVNAMVCSSAASERVWSIYRFIHTRLRNRLCNERVEKLAFIYINCAILDVLDPTDYISDDTGANLTGTDCQEADDE